MEDLAESESHGARLSDDEVADKVDGGHLNKPVDLGGQPTLQTRLKQKEGEVLGVPVRLPSLPGQVPCKQDYCSISTNK